MSVMRPIWLGTPSRYAGIAKARARAILAVFALLIGLCALMPTSPPPPGQERAVAPRNAGESDLILYETITDGIRHGGNYYAVVARELRSRPGYPLRPFLTFRLPTLAVLQAALPPVAIFALMLLLAMGVTLAWGVRIIEALPQPAPRAIAALMLGAGLFTFVQPALQASHEIWAALLIALSLALRRPGRWVEAVAIATMAMLIRETAALYVIMMMGIAWLEGHRREAIGWGVSLGVLAAAIAAHAWAVAQVTGPLDPVSDGWSGMNGFWFFVMTIRHATMLEAFPYTVAVPVVVVAMLGWTAWRSPLALRMAATIAIYAVLIAGFARLNNFYWGLMVAPVFLVGLAFAPDGLRDLWSAAFPRRRITVTRVVR